MSKASLKEVYREFCEMEGNQHIASEYAILKLNELIRQFNLKTILELGLGIGTIPCCLLQSHKSIKYMGTEKNQYCLNVLEKNIYNRNIRLNIFSDLSKIPKIKFDLIIIDGKDSNLAQIKNNISKRGIIAIEGDRKLQQEVLLQFFPNQKNVHSISLKKNGNYSPFPSNHWQGGLKIIFINPTLNQKYWWLREKLFTKMKYFFRQQLN